MFKVSIITRHAIINYGSFLQALATQKIIESYNMKCEIIDYVRKDEDYRTIESALLKKKEKWNRNILLKMLYLCIRQPSTLIAGKRFEGERKEYLNLSKRYSTVEELKNDTPSADMYVSGSDQVWGPTGDGSIDDSYLLSFTNKRKIAFASSFGHGQIREDRLSVFKKYLTKYEAISIREQSGVDILKAIDIKANRILDPTLMVDSTFWEQYLTPMPNEEYILVYQLHNNAFFDKFVKKLAKEKKMKVVRISPMLYHVFRPGRMVWCLSFKTFLSYVKKASYVITDSFHGTAFAINFNIPFWEIIPQNGTETRNRELLEMFGLSERIITDYDCLDTIDNPINYACVNEILKRERAKSRELLLSMLVGEKNENGM